MENRRKCALKDLETNAIIMDPALLEERRTYYVVFLQGELGKDELAAVTVDVLSGKTRSAYPAEMEDLRFPRQTHLCPYIEC